MNFGESPEENKMKAKKGLCPNCDGTRIEPEVGSKCTECNGTGSIEVYSETEGVIHGR